jgi:DNA-binding beta-propeller fold protein YncE
MRAALIGLCAAILLVSGCSGSDDSPEPAPEASAAVTEVDGDPVGVADVDGQAWTVLVGEGAVRTGDDQLIDVGETPLRIVQTPDGVWVSVIGDGTVVRIDPATGSVDKTVTLKPKGSEPEGLAWDGESLWVVDQAGGRVVQLDADGAVVGSFDTDDEPRLVAAGDSGIWVANYGASSVSRVTDGTVMTVPSGCVGPQGIAEAGGFVWVACTLSGKVVALDVASMVPTHEIELPDADAVVADGDTVYAVGQSGPTVLAIDSASGEVRETLTLDEAFPTGENVGAAVVSDTLVVTHPDVRKIYTLPLP